jgi:hypothetical protein
VSRADCIIDHSAGVRTGLVGNQVNSEALRPHSQLINGSSTKRVAGRENDLLPALLMVSCQLGDTGRLPRAIDTHNQHNRWWLSIVVQIGVPICVQHPLQMLFEQSLHFLRTMDAITGHLFAKRIDELNSGIRTYVRLDEQDL